MMRTCVRHTCLGYFGVIALVFSLSTLSTTAAAAVDKDCAKDDCDLLEFTGYIADKVSTIVGFAKGVIDVVDLLFGTDEIERLRVELIKEMEELRDEEWARAVDGLLIDYILLRDNYTLFSAHPHSAFS